MQIFKKLMLIRGKRNLIGANTGGTARPVFIFAGQSNVDAFLQIADLEAEYQQIYRGVNFYQHSSSKNVKFVPLNHTSNPDFQAPNQTNRYALQFYLYPELKTLLGKDIFIVHHAQGATSLATDWLSTTVGSYYSDLVFKTKATINAITDADGFSPSVKFFYWGQGETDAANSTNANNYQTNLTNLINNFRTAVGVADLPVLIGRINSGIDAATYPFWETVRTAQEAVVEGGGSAISGVYLVNQDDAEMAADDTHYTQAGYKTIKDNIISVAQTNGLI